MEYLRPLRSMHRTVRPYAVALCLTALSCAGTDPTGILGGAGAGEVTACALDSRYLSLSAAAKDGIPAIDEPVWVDPSDARLWYLQGSDRVVGIVVEGQPYAVPLNVLWYHEIVNAELSTSEGAMLVSVTHCPLTGTSLVFDRSAIGGAELGVSGILYQSNLVMYDRNTEESLWPQMLAEARCGPARGTSLPTVGSIEMRLDGWVDLHPDTKVLAAPGEGHGYDVNPYSGYDAPHAEYTFSMPPLDERLPPKARVLGVARGGAGSSTVFPFSELEELGPYGALDRSFGPGAAEAVVLWDRARVAAGAYRREVDGVALNFRADEAGFYDVQTGSRWAVDGRATEGALAGERLEAVALSYVGYWGAWAAFFDFPLIWGATGPSRP